MQLCLSTGEWHVATTSFDLWQVFDRAVCAVRRKDERCSEMI